MLIKNESKPATGTEFEVDPFTWGRNRASSESSAFCVQAPIRLLLASLAIFCNSGPIEAASDEMAKFKKAGFEALSAAEAAEFLVGNSIIVRKLDAATEDDGKIYYFPTAGRMYQCGTTASDNCYVAPWRIKGDKICLVFGECEPFEVLRSPQLASWTTHNGRIGAFRSLTTRASYIVKGNWTDAPQFEPKMQGRPLTMDRREIVVEQGGAAVVRIRGTRAVSLLVGNTFLSDNATAAGSDMPAYGCPKQGRYYSSDGKIVEFTCDGSPDRWTIHISRWKITAGLFCAESAIEPGQFNCSDGVVTAAPPGSQSDQQDSFKVLDGNLLGFNGNVFAFQFEDHQAIRKAPSK